MKHPLYLVDAFATQPFKGNPAGVVVLSEAIHESWMQNVAMEMNQAETAFVWPKGDDWNLVWYTPTTEVDLCGHATLGAAEVLYRSGRAHREINFHTKSGLLECVRAESGWTMDFPAENGAEHTERGEIWRLVSEILGAEPIWLGRNRMDWLAQVEEDVVRALRPDFEKIAKLGMRGLIVTAQDKRGQNYDFVSRFFAPQSGVPEDPVTGSAHCFLGPFWSPRLAKTTLTGFQASSRGGTVSVNVSPSRCLLGGSAIVVVEGALEA